MNYSIKVKSQEGQEKITEFNGSGKIVINSADQINFSSSGKYENMIVLRKGNDLEIHLENGDVLTFTNFYSYADATSILFSDGDGVAHTLLSTDTSMSDLGDGTFLVYAQGSQSTLLSMASIIRLYLLFYQTSLILNHLQMDHQWALHLQAWVLLLQDWLPVLRTRLCC